MLWTWALRAQGRGRARWHPPRSPRPRYAPEVVLGALPEWDFHYYVALHSGSGTAPTTGLLSRVERDGIPVGPGLLVIRDV